MAGSPVRYSARLGRRIRQDDVETVGTSTQTLCEEALTAGRWEVAADLASYFAREIQIINAALFSWLGDIVAFSLDCDGRDVDPTTVDALLAGLGSFDAPGGDRDAAVRGALAGDGESSRRHLELMRARLVLLHDALVAWIQRLLADLADRHGDEAGLAAVERAYERLWAPRYRTWPDMSPLEKLQLSVEGMRGHLSGARRRGDVGVDEEYDRYVMSLDPCGSCGILRRGDPETGRPAATPAGPGAHPWTWFRADMGWYAVHSAIVMEYRWYREGLPPMRPLDNCDRAGPCRWFVYKDPTGVRPEHAAAMGFER